MNVHENAVLHEAHPEVDGHQDKPQAGPHGIFSVPEMLSWIAENLEDNHDLCNFSRVSKAFHRAGVPVLYRNISLPVPDLFLNGCLSPPRHVSELSQPLREAIQRELLSRAPSPDNPHLHWVRSLRCGDRQYEHEGLDEEGIRPVHWLQHELLEHLTGLTSYQSLSMAPNPLDINRLKRCCPNISAIDIVFSRIESLGPWRSWAAYYSPRVFEEFKGLKRLCLLYMTGNLDSWRQVIIKSLLACPGLTHLSLGLDLHSSFWHPRLKHVESDVSRLFSQICHEYAAAGASPLCLRTMELHHGFWLVDSSAFRCLVTPSSLEEVHLDNHFRWRHGAYESGNRPSLDLSPFSKTNCPKLKRFTFYAATPDVGSWLVKVSPDFSEQLVVHFRKSWDEDRAESKGDGWLRPHESWGWYDDNDFGLKMMPQPGPPCMKSIPPFRGFQLGGHLGTRFPWLEKHIDMLDQLSDKMVSVHGHSLEELVLCQDDYSSDHFRSAALESFHCSLVSRLPKLQDVVLWPLVSGPRDERYKQRERMAHMLALASGFQSCLRRILVSVHIAMELVRSGEHGFRFRQMDLHEMDAIPVFKFYRDLPEESLS